MIVRFFRISLFAICIILPGLSVAQVKEEFRLENINSEYTRVEHGLSQNSVNCILQDRRGFLWIGTWSGLNRFDGYNVKILTKDHYHPEKSLTNASIYGLAEDNDGYIWAATTKGLNKIDPVTFKITQYTTKDYGSSGFINDSLSCVYFDSHGLLWLGTRQGAISMDPATETFKSYQHNPRDTRTLSDRFVTCFEEDNTNLWIGTNNGLNCLVRKTGQILNYYGGKEPGRLSSSHITALDYSKDGYLWVGTSTGVNRLDFELNWFNPYYIIYQTQSNGASNPNFITSLHNDSGHDLWVGTQEFGLFLLDKNSNRFKNINDFTNDASIVNTNSILSIEEDKNGLYWVGTSHRGLVKFVPEENAFKPYIEGKATYGIELGPDNNLWFGTQNGVYIYNRSLENVVDIIDNQYDKSSSLTSNRISNIYKDGDEVWIATRYGLNKYDANKNITQFLSDGSDNTIVGNEVWGITKASDSTFWFSTKSGLSNYDPKTDTFTNYRHDPDDPNSLSSNGCYNVFEMEPGRFLIATEYGLNKFDSHNKSWDVYLPIPNDLTSISSEYIFGIFQDSHDEIWIFTNGGGISKFDKDANTFIHFTKLDGLADDIAYGITEDKAGFFWIITNNGLSRFDPEEERFLKYDVQDGLLSNEFNLNGFYQTEDGEIFAAGVNGISSFYPPSPSADTVTLSVNFTEFFIHQDGQGVELPLSDVMKLNHEQNTFHISFAALDYLNPFKNRFEYKLVNYDKNFTTLDLGVHTVEYRKLPPGDYRLEIVGSNSRGTTAKKSIKIKIIPAWWQTLIFKILASALSISFISLIILIRYKGIQNRHKMDKQLLTIQTELVQSQKFALRSQMNPHFIFNSLNSIQNFVLKNDVDSANYYLSNFSIMMRRVLEYSQHNFITLNEEIQLIELYIKMEKLRFSNKFDNIIKIDPKIDVHDVKIPPMLLQPYLENAILHGLQLIKHRGELIIRFFDRIDCMDIEIEDNGIGRAKATKIQAKRDHKSKGLKNIEKRIQLYNKLNQQPISVSINDLFENGEPSGTMVKLSIPYELDEPES